MKLYKPLHGCSVIITAAEQLGFISMLPLGEGKMQQKAVQIDQFVEFCYTV